MKTCYILHFIVCLFDQWYCQSLTKHILEGNNQQIILGLIISVSSFTRKITSHLNISCLPLLSNVLIQLNESICRKTCYILHYVVCLFAYIDWWNYQNQPMPKSQNNFSHRSTALACLMVYWALIYMVHTVMYTLYSVM